MARVFLTGASGYIGGHVLHELAPDSRFSIVALVRNPDHGKAIAAKYPKVRVVEGDLDDSQIIETEASAADIVLHLAHNKHIKSVEAIANALSSRKLSSPAYYIQISGASVLAANELASKSFTPGSASDATFDDYDGVEKLRDLIRAHQQSRFVDNFVLDLAARSPGIQTALIFPPIIYGQGQGPVNQRSVQVPTLAKVTLTRGNGVQIGKGLNRWANVHIRDLGRLIGKLVGEASQKQPKDKLWSEHGLYLTGVGETTFAEISQRILESAKNQSLVKPDAVVEELYGEDASTVIPYGPIMYGTNARGKGRRAEVLLDWKPKEESLDVEIPRAVAEEASRT
ncbi:putative NAD-dependent epimerase/dehydratase domain-containing protein [Seiridium cardinale]|uniref:NAD-dependent epimerase/dehydratase domain-containing protein n=1 Tax=Seiridium cardinale TaxID=138064 RepID=A0ABR2XXX5_9PEZI